MLNPQQPGTYFLLDKKNNIVKIGRSGNIANRVHAITTFPKSARGNFQERNYQWKKEILKRRET